MTSSERVTVPVQIVAIGNIISGCRSTLDAYRRAYGRGERYRLELGSVIPDRISEVRRVMAMVPHGRRGDVIRYLRSALAKGGDR